MLEKFPKVQTECLMCKHTDIFADIERSTRGRRRRLSPASSDYGSLPFPPSTSGSLYSTQQPTAIPAPQNPMTYPLPREMRLAVRLIDGHTFILDLGLPRMWDWEATDFSSPHPSCSRLRLNRTQGLARESLDRVIEKYALVTMTERL